MGIWRDTYFFTFNCFSPNAFTGSSIVAINRDDMLSGATSPRAREFRSGYGSPLPADVDSWEQPPAGGPSGVILSLGYQLYMWRIFIDWNNPSAATMTGPTSITTGAWNQLCPGLWRKLSAGGQGGRSSRPKNCLLDPYACFESFLVAQ